MATLAHGTHSADLTGPRTRHATLLARLVHWYRAKRELTTTLRDLNRMEARDLRDLGITHYDFEAIAQGSFKR